MIGWVFATWFFFFLLNYAAITRRPASWLKRVLGPKLSYPLSCAACWPFWTTLLGCIIFFDVYLWWCFVVPVLHLFLDLVYHKLLWRPGEPPKEDVN
jgi:hypothetical protein